jgi:hypothetical protein
LLFVKRRSRDAQEGLLPSLEDYAFKEALCDAWSYEMFDDCTREAEPPPRALRAAEFSATLHCTFSRQCQTPGESPSGAYHP